MRKYFHILLLLTAPSFVFAAQMTRADYIAKYKDFAIIEMHRSGVPASITLAQGILESSNGNSRLATQANNHFGIKCKSDWTGKTIRADDDAPNECFRAYESVLESYRDHSDFLRDNWRYHPLFELDRTDYKGWARGLRKAGYATNKQYDDLLIRIIEQSELYQYDLAPLPGNGEQVVIVENDIPAVYVREGETVNTIAKGNDLRPRQIYRWNDMPEGSEVREGEIIYLKPKRRRGGSRYHVVMDGETMYQISQMYGIKLKHLYKKNRMEPGTQPIAGEKLYMQKKRKKDDEVDVDATDEEKFAEEDKDEFVNPNKVVEIQKAPAIERSNIDVPEYHVVVAGDNIYRIAERYHVFEEDILEWNNINSHQLKIGQKIYLSAEAARKHLPTKPASTIVVEDKEEKKVEPSSAVKYHTVESGETVYRICKTYGITEQQLQDWNNLNSVTIYVGQKLIVGK